MLPGRFRRTPGPNNTRKLRLGSQYKSQQQSKAPSLLRHPRNRLRISETRGTRSRVSQRRPPLPWVSAECSSFAAARRTRGAKRTRSFPRANVQVTRPARNAAIRSRRFTAVGSVSFMSKAFGLPCLLLLVLLQSVFSPPTEAQERDLPSNPAAACLAFKHGLSLGAPLALTQAKLRAGGALRIVAFGSSSTTGFGSFGSPFPDVMKQELAKLHPSVKIQLINSGRIMEDLGDNVARIDRDHLSYKPMLSVCQ